MKNDRVKVYCFKYGFLWVAWVMYSRKPSVPMYYNNETYEALRGGAGIAYMTVGATENATIRRTIKWIRRKIDGNN